MKLISSQFTNSSFLKVTNNTQILLSNLEYIQGIGNYTLLHFSDNQQFILSKSLKYYENLLAKYGFIRPNKSFLLNSMYIVAYSKSEIRLQSGKTFNISRRKQRTLTDFNNPIENNIKIFDLIIDNQRTKYMSLNKYRPLRHIE